MIADAEKKGLIKPGEVSFGWSSFFMSICKSCSKWQVYYIHVGKPLILYIAWCLLGDVIVGVIQVG